MDRTDRFMLLAFVLLAASFAAHGAREESFNQWIDVAFMGWIGTFWVLRGKQATGED